MRENCGVASTATIRFLKLDNHVISLSFGN